MVRPYQDWDYEQLKELYLHSEWYGGQFDEARDSRKRLASKTAKDPESIWLYEQDGKITGTISLIDDGRVAWLFRFAVKANDQKIARELYNNAIEIFKKRGHKQVLVYTPVDDQNLSDRYEELGMTRGNEFTAYWKEI